MFTRRKFLATTLATPMLARPVWAAEEVIKLRDLYDRKAISALAKSTEGQRITPHRLLHPQRR